MASHEAQLVRDALLPGGVPADTPVALAEGVSLHGTARSGALRDLPALVARGPALVLIGEVFGAISTKAVDMSVESRRYTASYAYDNRR